MQTKDEIENVFFFTFIKKFLRKKYPYIKDIKLSEDFERYNSLLFIDLYFDLNELIQVYNLGINSFYPKSARYLPSFFDSDMPKDKLDFLYNLTEHISEEISKIYESSHIPDELKTEKKLSVGEWVPLKK